MKQPPTYGTSQHPDRRWRPRCGLALGAFEGCYGNNARRTPPPEPRQAISLDKIRAMLAPADATQQKQAETPKEYFDKPPAALEQLSEGVRVLHPTFGAGAVVSVSGSSTSAMVTMKFDSFEEPKKVVFRFAKLVLG